MLKALYYKIVNKIKWQYRIYHLIPFEETLLFHDTWIQKISVIVFIVILT